jgi:TonB family protein
MTRLQKKCMVFSLGAHVLLGVILLVSAGFGSRPAPTEELHVLTMISANIVDRAGSGGGTTVVNPKPQPPAQPRAQSQPQPQPQPQAVHIEQSRPEPERPTPRPRKETTRDLPTPDDSKESSLESTPKISKRHSHEVQVSYTPAHPTTRSKKPDTNQSSESSARAEARKLKEIETSLAQLASGVRSSGSQDPIVDTEGIGGGEAFAGYRDVVFSAYYHAWITPDNAASRTDTADAKVTIARDGSIIYAELVRPSDDKALNKSVERALSQVTKLPPFPASTTDAQRTYVIRFSLEAKEMAG